MQTRKIATIVTVVAALIALLAASSTVAGPPVPEGEGSDSITLAGTVGARDPDSQGEPGAQAALGSAFTYQGQLNQGGTPVTGTCDFQFSLWDAASGGTQVGSTQSLNNVSVNNGLFTVQLDFGNGAFQGDARWLEIGVRCPAGSGSYATLGPRQALTAGPYALHAISTGALQRRSVADIPPAAGQVLKWDGSVWAPATDEVGAGGPGAHDHWGETWQGVGVGLTLRNAEPLLTTDVQLGAVTGPAVNSYSMANAGVRGDSMFADGVQGEASASDKSGVYGYNTQDGYGVFGRSTNGFGLGAAGGGDGSINDRVGDLVLAGDRGEIFSFGTSLDLYSDGNVDIHLDDNDNDANAALWILDGKGNIVGFHREDGTKSAVLQTKNYGQRAVYSMESPGVWLEDFGSASLVNGVATVTLEPIFAETVNTEKDYHIFVTPLCEEPVLVFVTSKTTTGFTVRGVTLDGQPTNCSFDYRIAAKRLGLEDIRLELVSATGDSE